MPGIIEKKADALAALPLRRLGSYSLALIGAVAVALALEAWLGDGFTWLPRSPLAWLAALSVFALGEGFLHWFLLQAKYVAEQDVAFQAVASPPRRDLDSTD